MSRTPDPYEILGLARDATPEQIRRAHRRLVKALHPDAGGAVDGAGFHRVQEAYLLLRDPARRAAYDARHPLPRSGAGSPTGGTRSPQQATDPATVQPPSMWPSPSPEEFELYARSSVTAWSSAARAYFRRRAEAHHRAPDAPPSGRPHR